MRFFWTDIYPGHFDTFWEARSARRRAIARREILAKPEPTIVKIQDGWRVRGAIVVGGSFGLTSSAPGRSPREVLIGTPLKPLRPKHRKGKRSSAAIQRPLLRRP
jgi:hypothetical protein